MKKFITFFALFVFITSCSAKNIHPQFDITQEEFESIIAEVPEEIQAQFFYISLNGIDFSDKEQIEEIEKEQLILEAEFLDYIEKMINLPEALTILADKQHHLGADYKPEELFLLSEVDGLYVRPGREQMLMLSTILKEDLLEMSRAADAEGIKLVMSSCYRSYATQKRTFAYWCSIDGEEKAQMYSARPGTSQHQLGTAIDFGSITEAFGDTPAGKWLYKNAWKYGFSLSYPEGMTDVTGYDYEIWHYRYVGKYAAEFERKFFNGVQQYMLEFFHNNKDFFIERYKPGV